MLIIPEVQTIALFTPRTGSSSFAAALSDKFPRSFLLYRHAEADAIPEGFVSYRRVGFVRHPLARLWSLFKFCSTINVGELAQVFPEEAKRVAASVEGLTFETWMLNNEELFLPQETQLPYLFQKHHIPETRKSAQIYLRPDLGGLSVLKFEDMEAHMVGMGLDPKLHLGATPTLPIPKITGKMRKHLERWFPWEMDIDLKVL